MPLAIPNLDDLESVTEGLFTFVWSFKHGDNIMYNFSVLQALYIAQRTAKPEGILNKPTTILLVSIIEAILIDFLSRIDQATHHLPPNVDRATLNNLKQEIESKKRSEKIEDEFGERIYLRRKLYQFNEIVELLKKYELFGKKDDSIYDALKRFGHLRNRVHIENYHQNFEDREDRAFTQKRLTELERVLGDLWTKMTNDYKRPWKPASLL
jgi:hypothetical protein